MDAGVLADLKAKFIDDFDKLRIHLYQGKNFDCKILKYLICVINDSDYFNNKTQEFLINYV